MILRYWMLCLIPVLVASSGCRPDAQPGSREKTGDGVFGLAEDDIRVAQGKLTYHGAQTKPVATLVFFTDEAQLSMTRFTEFQRGDGYWNDRDEVTSRPAKCAVSVEEFHRLLRSVKSLVSLNESRVIRVDLTFTIIVDTKHGVFGGEFLVDDKQKGQLYVGLSDSMSTKNVLARKCLGSQCWNATGAPIGGSGD
jgi:hypothetical protein